MKLCPCFDLLEPLMSLHQSSQMDLTADKDQGTTEIEEETAQETITIQEEIDDNEPEFIALASEDEKCFLAKSPAPKKGRYEKWDNDRVRVDLKSSIEVVLDWLASGNNYSRWLRDEEPRTKVLCVEIKRLLEAEGIHRTAQAVYKAMVKLAIKIQKALQILSEHNVTGVTSWNECNDDIKSQVLACCPHFDKVAIAALKSVETEEKTPSEAISSEVTERQSDESAIEVNESDSAFAGQDSLPQLLDWITDNNNYDRWRKAPHKQELLASEIHALLIAQGITHCSLSSIKKQIWRLEESMTQANLLITESNCVVL